MKREIQLADGNGGLENSRLIKEIFFKNFKNEILERAEDSAIIFENLAFTTDSYTVKPLFFKGGDIGKLSVCGSCNDLAMMGAKPLYLTISFIIEEGFLIEDLDKIAKSIQSELLINGAKIVAGDTKVVPKGSVDGVFINTSAVGEVKKRDISSSNLEVGDSIIFSNSIGEHGSVIFSEREEIELESKLKSDSASLWPVVKRLIQSNLKIRAMRDATRGGVASLLNEWCIASNLSIEIEEERVPIKDEVLGVCELIGFEPYSLANEGTFAIAIAKDDSKRALEILHSFEICKRASIVGKVIESYEDRVILKSSYGTERFLDMPSGELLPRIC